MAWQIKQLEKLNEIEPGLIDEAVGRLLEADPILREKLVVGAYLDGDISISRAAELLEVHAVELRQRFLKKGIPVRIGAESVDALKAEVASAEHLEQA